MIVVTAAGGSTGGAVVRALCGRGLPVRAVVGSPRPRPELAGAEVVVADLAAPESVAPLLAGGDTLYLMWPNFDPREADGATALFREARAAGVGRVVYHSVLRPQARSMPHHAGKDRAEEALDRSGLSWRVLQPCAYARNLDAQLRAAARSGCFTSAWGLQQAQSFVDVADAAVALLTLDGLDGGTFEAAGPQPLDAPQIAELLSARLGRRIRAVDAVPDGPVPPDSDYAAHCLRRMLDHYRSYGFVGSPRMLETLIGRPARTFAEHLAALELGA